jgi:hypothetical protein
MLDLASHIYLKRLIAESVVTTSPTAFVIDRLSGNVYEGIAVGMHIGAGGITFTGTNYIALKFEDCDDNSSWLPVTSANSVTLGANSGSSNFGQSPDANGFVRLINAVKASADTDPFKVGYIGNRRYLRVTIVLGGTHATGTLVGAWAVLGRSQYLPAA